MLCYTMLCCILCMHILSIKYRWVCDSKCACFHFFKKGCIETLFFLTNWQCARIFLFWVVNVLPLELCISLFWIDRVKLTHKRITFVDKNKKKSINVHLLEFAHANAHKHTHVHIRLISCLFYSQDASAGAGASAAATTIPAAYPLYTFYKWCKLHTKHMAQAILYPCTSTKTFSRALCIFRLIISVTRIYYAKIYAQKINKISNCFEWRH